jgi:hypothetical protein
MPKLREKLIEYEPPQIVTYTEEDILDELGPALTAYENILPIFE